MFATAVVLAGAMSVVVESAEAQARPTATARPTRPPRVARTIARPSRPPRLPRPVRPTRVIPGAPTATSTTIVAPVATPTAPPSSTTAVPATTSTPTPTRTPQLGASCAAACPFYNLSQMRLTWYDPASGGLNLSFYVQPGSCAALTPENGEEVSIRMDRWLTYQRVDTGRLHVATATLGGGGFVPTSTGGTLSVSSFGSWQQVTYRAPLPPIAGPQDGAEFPVVFDICLTIGDQAVTGRMVCQEKNRGFLCHEG